AKDEAVHEQTEIDGFEAAKKSCRLAGVAELGEFDVGHDFRATPITREEKDGEHTRKALIPPKPVACDPLRRDEPGNEQRSIGGECGRDHRGACKPPGNVAARDEELSGVAARALAIIDAD